MELQKFINENSDYIKTIRKNDVQVNINKSLNVAIMKYNRNKKDKYDFDKSPWIRYCKGAVVDLDTNKVICVPPKKSDESKDINKIVNEYNSENTYQPLIDGTMINMFYKNDQWHICTRSNIGANNSWDGRIKFKDLFTEINGTKWFDVLDKRNCYSFVFQHVKNRIVTPIIENQIFLIQCYNTASYLYPVKCEQLPTIEGIINVFNITEGQIGDYIQPNDPLYYSIKGLSITSTISESERYSDDKRVKWINPEFNKVLELKPNNNNKFMNYMELCKNERLSEYMYYFQEDNQLFIEYYKKYMNLKMELLNSYINTHIRKRTTSKELKFVLRPLVYELHGDYLKTKEKINDFKVDAYLKSLPDTRLLFVINRL